MKGIAYEEEEFSEGSGYRFVKTADTSYAALTREDIEILDKIIQVCGKDTREQIVNRMHKESAYQKTVQGDVIRFQYALELSVD